jgi:hypothetical protein
MRVLLLLSIGLLSCFSGVTQSACDEFYQVFKTVDSLVAIAKAHKGDSAFQKSQIFSQYNQLTCYGIKSEARGGWIVFNFFDTDATLMLNKLEMCTQRYANEHHLFSKSIEADKQTRVYANKKESNPIFFIGIGSGITKDGQLKQNVPYLFISYRYY